MKTKADGTRTLSATRQPDRSGGSSGNDKAGEEGPYAAEVNSFNEMSPSGLRLEARSNLYGIYMDAPRISCSIKSIAGDELTS
jgi:hypothetical protein